MKKNWGKLNASYFSVELPESRHKSPRMYHALIGTNYATKIAGNFENFCHATKIFFVIDEKSAQNLE